MKRAPEPAVVAWLATIGADFAISAISIEELRYGALRMPAGRRRENTVAAVDAICAEHGNRVLAFTAEDALTCADLRAIAWGSGNNVAYQDIAICATALRRGLVVATRNVRDFAPLGVDVFNPFDYMLRP